MAGLSESVLHGIANPAQADVFGSFNQGVAMREKREGNELTADILKNTVGTKVADLIKLDPNRGLELAKAMGIPLNEKDRIKNVFGNIVAANQMLQIGTDPREVAEYLGEQASQLEKGGISTQLTQNAIKRLTSGNPDEIMQQVDSFNEMTQQILGPEKAAKTSAQIERELKVKENAQTLKRDQFNRGDVGTSSQRDFETFQNLSQAAKASGDPAAIEAAEQFGRQSGFTRETAQEQADIDVAKAGGIAEARASVDLAKQPTIEASKEAAKSAIKRSEKAFTSIENINKNLLNIDEAISLIDEGAKTGVIQSKLPSVRSASIALDNLQGRLGLDVLNTTTFGALSEGELKFALATALPKNLEPADLRRWLEKKKATQIKLSGYLQEVATFLGTPGNTTKDFIELQKLNQLDAESPQEKVAAAVDLTPLSMEELLKLRAEAQ